MRVNRNAPKKLNASPKETKEGSIPGRSYLQDIQKECAQNKQIQDTSKQNNNVFRANFDTTEKEERLLGHEELEALSGADVNRITPRYFL